MRVITLVVKDLIELIPEDENIPDRFKTLKDQINKNIIESIPFAEPSIIKSNWFWNKLSLYVDQYITREDYQTIQWCRDFIDIFQDPFYKKNVPEYHFNE